MASNTTPTTPCKDTEHRGCGLCITNLWDIWVDPPLLDTELEMESKPTQQQPVTVQQQRIVPQHVHPEHQQPVTVQPPAAHSNVSTHHHLSPHQYDANARSPLLQKRHEIYGTGSALNNPYSVRYPQNDNYSYPVTDHSVNHNIIHSVPQGFNPEVHQAYMKRNPPKDTNQIYQNHEHTRRANTNQYGSKPYLPFSNRMGPQSNPELLKQQYNDLQQMKLQQQMHYQNQAQMHQQQKFAERQILLQQLHGVQPPQNLQNNLYGDTSYRDTDRYSSKNDFKEYRGADIQKDVDRYTENNMCKEMEKQYKIYQETVDKQDETVKQYQEPQWQTNKETDFREADRFRKQAEAEQGKSQSSDSTEVVSPMKSSDSSSPSIQSPSAETRRGGGQALRSPIAQRHPGATVTMSGVLFKQGSDGLKVWRKRWFVLSEYCLFYYKSQREQKLLGSVLLPSYQVSMCTPEDRVGRKYAFKLQHANMRTLMLAASEPLSMVEWVRVLKLAATMQSASVQDDKTKELTAAKSEDDEVRGPTYANAPPKPRRSNEGYISPSPEMYDPNYDILKKPASHYSQGTSHINTRYQEQTKYPGTLEAQHSRSPLPQSHQHQIKRPYDTQHLTLPLHNPATENVQPSTSAAPFSLPYFDRQSSQPPQEVKQEKTYDGQSLNPFREEMNARMDDVNITPADDASQPSRDARAVDADILNAYSRDVYGELRQPPRSGSLAERRTPDAYGRTQLAYTTSRAADYEDVYAHSTDHEYGNTRGHNPFQARDAQQPSQDHAATHSQEKTFSGPSVLRRKKMQASGIQPQAARPHSADFLEYEARQEMLNSSLPTRHVGEPRRLPQRPKSSLDINSYYDPSSDRYYSVESYAEKMRQSAQYLQQGAAAGPRNIQIPLAKYASGLAEKQLHSPYPQITNSNYEMETMKRATQDSAKYGDVEGLNKALNSNWTLKEKAELQREYLNRSENAMSNGESFMRSASARLPSTTGGEKRGPKGEVAMKRLSDWKDRMMQSHLNRKSTPAAISLARSLLQNRQALRTDQYKPSSYSGLYNSFSSDDEEETTGTDLQKTNEIQAGRSHRLSLTSPNTMRPITPRVPSVSPVDYVVDHRLVHSPNSRVPHITYENVDCTNNTTHLQSDEVVTEPKDSCHDNVDSEDPITVNDNNDQDGYETHESEADSETQLEYTDNDLDEVLLESDTEIHTENLPPEQKDGNTVINENKSETPPIRPPGEDHYLPMSPRKTSTVEPAHKTILQNISVFNPSLPQKYEDNPYVEMNVGNDEEDMQTYEIVCVANGKVEPVYMELSNFSAKRIESDETSTSSSSKLILDTASNFADTKDLTLKRASKGDKSNKEKSDCSDTDDEESKDLAHEVPFSRFSISDNFRPASYYLGASIKTSETIDSSDSENFPPPHVSSFTQPCNELSGEALSQYILDKIDKSEISQDSSILKMLTNENKKMTTVKKKTTSLMIYGSRTSIHDTLSRGEKIRNSRASLTNDKKLNESSSNILSNSILEHYNSSSIESDSLRSYNADRGSSRLSIESDTSSKFEIGPSNVSSDVTSLNESDIIDYRYSRNYDLEMIIKRRPLSDDSVFENSVSESHVPSEPIANLELDKYLGNLQLSSSTQPESSFRFSGSEIDNLAAYKDSMMQASNFHSINHTRSSSTPVTHANKKSSNETHNRVLGDPISGFVGSQSSCSSRGNTKSPLSYYCKDYDEKKILSKNLNSAVLADKIKEFDGDKLALKSGMDTNTSSTTTGFHSRESSTEHSAPYYYSDLSSQEHINLMPTSHYLKNTNLHRKLNNQRRRGPFLKKTEISHIHNPIRNGDMVLTDSSFDIAASARSVSVEFLSAADKDPEIDMKNIYESGIRNSKIPESMSLSGLGCKRNSSTMENSSPDSSATRRSSLNNSCTLKISNASMSSHCSGNSSNTVYYDAEAEASETRAYENVVCQGEKHWDEDALWRDNLRRVSHRHARSMDDLDTVPSEISLTSQTSGNTCAMNSIKRVKKNVPSKISRNVTYVNCDIQSEVQRRRENSTSTSVGPDDDKDDNDVYVSLVENSVVPIEQCDEGVYEQLAVDASDNSMTMPVQENIEPIEIRNKRRRFEIDREKLRQWDLMSSGLMKAAGHVRGAGAAVGTDTGTRGASSQASTTMARKNLDLGINNSSQPELSKKGFLGSNTSIGRSRGDLSIPVSAVSPRVRWIEDRAAEHARYGSRQISTSQHNLDLMNGADDIWRDPRSPQQPISAVSPRVRINMDLDDMRGEESAGATPTAGELLARTHEELVLLLIQLRRRHAATHRAIEQCAARARTVEDNMSSLEAIEREESKQMLEQLKRQLMELRKQYTQSKPLVQLVDNMVKLGSVYNRPTSTVDRMERNQRLRQKVLVEHAAEHERWIENAAAGKPLETEASRERVIELWCLEQELADEAAILQGMRTERDAINALLTGIRGISNGSGALPEDYGGITPQEQLIKVHEMLARNSKELERTLAQNERIERELQEMRRALRERRAAPPSLAANHRASIGDEVGRMQLLVTQIQQQREELSLAVRELTEHSATLSRECMLANLQHGQMSRRQGTNVDAGHTTEHGACAQPHDHGYAEQEYNAQPPPGQYHSGNTYDAQPPPSHSGLEYGARAQPPPSQYHSGNTYNAQPPPGHSGQEYGARAQPPPAHSGQEYGARAQPPPSQYHSRNTYDAQPPPTHSGQEYGARAQPPPSQYHSRNTYDAQPPSVHSGQEYGARAQPPPDQYHSSNTYNAQPPDQYQSGQKYDSRAQPPPDEYCSGQEYDVQPPDHYDNGHEYGARAHPPPDEYRGAQAPLYVDTRPHGADSGDDLQFSNLSNVEKQEIKTVRIVKRESERRQRGRERCLQTVADWPAHNLAAGPHQSRQEGPPGGAGFSRGALLPITPDHPPYSRGALLPITPDHPPLGRGALLPITPDHPPLGRGALLPITPDHPPLGRGALLPITPDHPPFRFRAHHSRHILPQIPPLQLRSNDRKTNMELSPKFPSSPSLSSHDCSRELGGDYNRECQEPGSNDRTMSASTQYLSSPIDSGNTQTNDSSDFIVGHMQLSPIFKSEAAKQIITEMSVPASGSPRRRQVPKVKRRHNTAPHHLSANALRQMPDNEHDKLRRSLDDADMERALRAAPAPDVVRSALAQALTQARYADTIDQLLAAPQKILIPERYIPEMPPELSPEEQRKRQEKVESIKKMLSGSNGKSADPKKSPDGEDKRQRQHLLQMNQILAKQVTEMSKIIAVKALEEMSQQNWHCDLDDHSPDVELPIYQQRDNLFT